MRKIYLFLMLILLFSCGYSADKINEGKIKQIFDKTDLWQYATSELKEKKMTFPVSNLIDGNPETCWATRVNGGVDEVVLIFFHLPQLDLDEKWQKGIGIMNGFAKSKGLYEANNRAKEIEVRLYRMLVDGVASENSLRMLYLLKMKLIEQTNITLQDKFGEEDKYYFSTDLEKDVKDNNPDKDLMKYALVISVKSVYKGSKYNDLCISEVKFLTE